MKKTRRRITSIPTRHLNNIPMRPPHKTFTRRRNLNFDPRLLDTTHLNEALSDFLLPIDSLISSNRIIGNLTLNRSRVKIFRGHLMGHGQIADTLTPEGSVGPMDRPAIIVLSFIIFRAVADQHHKVADARGLTTFNQIDKINKQTVYFTATPIF